MVGKKCTPSQSFSYYTITQYSLCKIYKDMEQAAILLAYGSICYTVGSDCSSMLTSLGMKYGLSVSSRSLSILLAYGSICYMVGSDSSSMLTSLGMRYGLSVSSRSLSILLAYWSICYVVGSDCSSMLTFIGMRYGLSVSSRSLSVLLAYWSICYVVGSDSSTMLTFIGMKYGLSDSSRSLLSGMFLTRSLMATVRTHSQRQDWLQSNIRQEWQAERLFVVDLKVENMVAVTVSHTAVNVHDDLTVLVNVMITIVYCCLHS